MEGLFYPSAPGAASPYLGQVATRCFVPSDINTGWKQSMTRSTHFARDNITSLQVVLSNFFVNSAASFAEAAPGAATSVTVAVEYPAGVYHRIRFSGGVTGTIPDGGSLVSDVLMLNIPMWAMFWIRIWRSNAVGLVYNTNYKALPTDGIATSGTTTPDLTMSGTVAAAGSSSYAPSAIIATTRRASVAIFGDSISYGSSDTANKIPEDQGYFARALGPSLAYINAARAGDEARYFQTPASSAGRRALAQYCSHVIIGHGRNDISGGRTPTQIMTDLSTIAGYFAGKTVMVGTIPPRSSSTDTWATLALQTAEFNAANRVSVNNSIRAGLVTGSHRYLDVADAMESDRNTGFWLSPGWTTDGIHPTALACETVAKSGAVNPGWFSR